MSYFRKFIKAIFVPISVFFDRMLVRMRIVYPKVILYVDGGLCSQMNMWADGEYYTEQGFDVYYDLEWFDKCGKGIDGVSVRNYELNILWPKVKVNTLPHWKLAIYKYLLPWPEASCVLPPANAIDRSVYFRGYHNLHEEDKIRIMRKNFAIDNAARTPNMQLDSTKRYCGVHIRRGDLANVSLYYYPQVQEGYFLRAIKYVQIHERVDEYLLFSDDPKWVKDNILPNVTSQCRVIEGNKGYEDLILLSQCPIIIASQGSFGRVASLINHQSELFISNFPVEKETYLANRVLQIQ